jgi:hypothetical protein
MSTVLAPLCAAPLLSSISHNNISDASVGIGLFTLHNYRKRLESDIPLDSHGQPLDPEDSGGLGPGSIALRDSYPVGHGNGGTAAVRLGIPAPCLSDMTTQLEPLLRSEEGAQDGGRVIFHSDVDTSDDDSDTGSIDP